MKTAEIIAGWITLPLLIWSCEKEDLTLPASLELSFSAEVRTALNGDVSLGSSEINSGSFRFIGKRNAAEDVDFTLRFDQPKRISLSDPSDKKVKADIPQGLYNSFDIQWNSIQSAGNFQEFNEELEDFLDDLNEDDDGDDDDNGNNENGNPPSGIIDDLDDVVEAYFENISPGIMIEAELMDGNQSIKIIFVIDDELIMELKVRGHSGNNEISLDADVNNNLLVEFDTDYWMKPLSKQVFKRAWKAEMENGDKVIFIHKSINPDIYTILLGRLENAFKAIKTE
jgi:hypothetical protein